MKSKIISIAILFLLLSSSLYGDAFVALLYSPEPREFTVNNQTWKSSDYMLGLKVGVLNISNKFGIYADYKGTFLFDDPKDETQYSYKIANVGIGFHFDKKFIIMGGAGYTWEVLKDIEGEDSELDNNNLNFNIGMMYYPYDNGLSFLVEYDSIPESVGFGLGYKF